MKLVDGNLVVRQFEEKDLEKFWQVAFSDEHAQWRQFNGPYFHDKYPDLVTFVNEVGPKNFVNKPTQAVIELDGQIVGIVSAYFEDGELKRWLDFGIVIHDDRHWGQNIGTRALTLWLTYLFSEYDLPHIGFTTWSGNAGMMRLGEKLGMQLEARVRSVRFWQGRYWDSIKYGILREEWQK
jgi:RimJ/RimL family protein N-acetyltransferase